MHCFHTQSLFICKVTTCYRSRGPHTKARPGSAKESNAEFTSEIALFYTKMREGGLLSTQKEVLFATTVKLKIKITALKGFAPP